MNKNWTEILQAAVSEEGFIRKAYSLFHKRSVAKSQYSASVLILWLGLQRHAGDHLRLWDAITPADHNKLDTLLTNKVPDRGLMHTPIVGNFLDSPQGTLARFQFLHVPELYHGNIC